MACQQLGWTEVPTITLEHLSEAQAKAFMIADNRLTEVSVWDDRLMAEQLKALSAIEFDFDLEAIGFETAEIDLRIESLTLGRDQQEYDPADLLVSRFRNKFSAPDGAPYLLGGLGPDKGSGVLVPAFHKAGDRPLQLRHAVEAAAADCLLANQAKPALHQVQPRGTGGCEMEMEARMGGQPLTD